MKIVQLKADNFKRLVAVEITPDGDLVLLSGKNNSGKSSALDAIWAALGGASACPDKPIREGAKKANIRLALDNGLVVERTFTKKGTYLKVAAKDGAQYPKPQDMLDALIGRVGFDPLAFARKKPKEQVVELLNVVDIGIDLDDHERKRLGLYDDRADANRAVKRLEGALAGQQRHDDAPAALVSAGDLAGNIAEVEKVNGKRMEAGNRIHKIEINIRELQQEAENLKTWLAAGEHIDVDPLKARLATVEADNEKVRANERYDQLNNEACSARATAANLEAELGAHDAKKDAALQQAKFPVAGLSFNDEGVLFNEIPFAQCSSSEQLRVAVGVAMAANPDLRVIQIREGSLLDKESLDVIAELAGTNGYQVWIEVVDESGDVGVVIEDGMVAGAELVKQES